MKRLGLKLVAVLMLIVFPTVIFAEEFNKVKYAGGMPGFEKEADGTLVIDNDKVTFKAEGFGGKGNWSFSVPVKSITFVSTGEKVQRRWKAAIVTTILFSPLGLLLLASKKKQGTVGIEFKNESDKSAGFPVFIVKKDVEPGIKALLEVKTGKTFKDDDKDDSGQKDSK